MAKEKETKLDHSNYKNKVDAVKAALDQISKKHGKEAAMRFGDRPTYQLDVIKSGSIGLDVALGVHGYPKGRIIEIYGPEASGKTTLTLHAMAEAQKTGGVCAFIDVEHALDPKYAESLGVKMDDVIISQPNSGEEALSIAETCVSSGGFDLVIVDSVAALVPQAEIDGEMGDHHVGTQARLMSQALRKLTALASQSKTTLIFINQIRMKIGVMFGNPETTTGGNALKFYASQRLEIRRIGVLKKGEEAIGGRTRVKVVKNKVAPPLREAEFDILYGQGVNYAGELVDIGTALGLVEKSGAWYSYNGERIGQGRDNSVEWFKVHADAMATLRDAVLKHYKPIAAATAVVED